MSSLEDVQGVRVAVEGCGHGTLNAIYSATRKACEARNWDGVDVLIIGGDFQAVRNVLDLTVMSVPAKFRELGDFHEYYSGKRHAPYLTIFVGGNHEASSHLWELFYGGWVAPNIYYMGAANVLRLGPIRIAAMSGIWKGYNYNKNHHERLPYNQTDIKSMYHIREFDVRKLLQLRTQVDIGISHDWPRAIEKHGNARELWRMKPDFRQESEDGTLGSLAAAYVCDRLRPSYWFSAHMHCRFAATKTYKAAALADAGPPSVAPEAVKVSETPAGLQNEEEIDLGMDDDDVVATPAKAARTKVINAPNTEPDLDALRSLLPASFSRPPPRSAPGQPVPATIANTTVRFLALDKCLPGRKFLQLLDVPPISPPLQSSADGINAENSDLKARRHVLTYDPEWLAITRVFNDDLVLGEPGAPVSLDLGEEAYQKKIIEQEAWVQENIVQPGKLAVPNNFSVTAPVQEDGPVDLNVQEQPREYNNPQMIAFCELLQMQNKFFATEEEWQVRKARGPTAGEDGHERRNRGFGGRGRGDRGRGRGGSRFDARGRGRGRCRWAARGS